jgi:hypothetical protein
LGDKWLKQLRKLFVVTTLDKLSNAFNVVCKKYYVAAVQHNLRTAGNYEAVHPDTDAGLDSIQTAAASIRLAAREAAPYLYDHLNDQRLQDLMAKLPIVKAIGKAHKFPWALRFLAASNATGLTPAAKWCTRILRAIEPALVAQWKGLFRSLPEHVLKAAGIVGDDPMPWFISNTASINTARSSLFVWLQLFLM